MLSAKSACFFRYMLFEPFLYRSAKHAALGVSIGQHSLPSPLHIAQVDAFVLIVKLKVEFSPRKPIHRSYSH
ncbi:MAG: hypothetical protein AWT59_2383 [Candidatus Gallionella acididurans]|uniref:Uncharacterized protein n=1 Tax=Candidatus Gallionella acididurans TaxID=1796491 RepID=A0A139BRC7_9PROT|nr:MAG: hypothetical protein AWT59_2383 [Candidatus Gallionella acididurans]